MQQIIRAAHINSPGCAGENECVSGATCMKIYRGALKCEHRMYPIGARSHYHGDERRRLVQFAAVTFRREGRAAAITVMSVHHIRRRWR